MKKILAGALALILTFGLVSCGKSDNESSVKEESSESALVTQENEESSKAESGAKETETDSENESVESSDSENKSEESSENTLDSAEDSSEKDSSDDSKVNDNVMARAEKAIKENVPKLIEAINNNDSKKFASLINTKRMAELAFTDEELKQSYKTVDELKKFLDETSVPDAFKKGTSAVEQKGKISVKIKQVSFDPLDKENSKTGGLVALTFYAETENATVTGEYFYSASEEFVVTEEFSVGSDEQSRICRTIPETESETDSRSGSEENTTSAKKAVSKNKTEKYAVESAITQLKYIKNQDKARYLSSTDCKGLAELVKDTQKKDVDTMVKELKHAMENYYNDMVEYSAKITDKKFSATDIQILQSADECGIRTYAYNITFNNKYTCTIAIYEEIDGNFSTALLINLQIE